MLTSSLSPTIGGTLGTSSGSTMSPAAGFAMPVPECSRGGNGKVVAVRLITVGMVTIMLAVSVEAVLCHVESVFMVHV